MDLSKLADIKYPEAAIFPLLRDHKAVIGPVAFDVIELIEKKFGDVAGMQKALTGDNVKKSDLFSVVYMMIENKDDYENSSDFAKYVPVMAIDKLAEVAYHFMQLSFPSADSGTDQVEGVESEEKK